MSEEIKTKSRTKNKQINIRLDQKTYDKFIYVIRNTPGCNSQTDWLKVAIDRDYAFISKNINYVTDFKQGLSLAEASMKQMLNNFRDNDTDYINLQAKVYNSNINKK